MHGTLRIKSILSLKMNVKHPMGVLHLFPTKNIFMIKWNQGFLFWGNLTNQISTIPKTNECEEIFWNYCINKVLRMYQKIKVVNIQQHLLEKELGKNIKY